MNLFILSEDMYESAKLLCDQHLNKQILELAQMLSTSGYGPYKPTHKNHPASRWVQNNLCFSFEYLKVLADEWFDRTGNWHKSYVDTCNYEDHIPAGYKDTGEAFPIENGPELIQRKYAEWASRPRKIIPRFSKITENITPTDVDRVYVTYYTNSMEG